MPTCFPTDGHAQQPTRISIIICLINDYLIKGSKEAAAHQCLYEFRKIIEKLEVSLEERMSSITKDDLFTAVADVLNTQAYVFKTCDDCSFPKFR